MENSGETTKTETGILKNFKNSNKGKNKYTKCYLYTKQIVTI